MKRFIMITTTIIITLIAVLAPILIITKSINENTNMLKNITLLTGGGLLLVLVYLSIEAKILKLDLKDFLILGFFIIALISFFNSSNKNTSLFGEKNRYEGILMLGTYVCIYMCSKKFFKYKKINTFLNIIFYVSLTIGILGILQNYIRYKKYIPIFGRGVTGTFGNTNFFGSYISLILPLAINIFVLKNKKRYFILSDILFYDMISTGTRSAWIAILYIIIFDFVCLIMQKNKKPLKNLIILLISFAILFIVLFSSFEGMHARAQLDKMKDDFITFSEEGIKNKLGSNRIEIWKIVIKLISKHPWIGVGPDNLKYGLMYDSPDDYYNYAENHGVVIDKAHNEYLQIAVTEGIPALLIYLSFVGVIILSNLKKINNDRVFFIILSCMFSYLIQAFFNISTIGVAPLFWILLGLIDNKEIKLSLD